MSDARRIIATVITWSAFCLMLGMTSAMLLMFAMFHILRGMEALEVETAWGAIQASAWFLSITSIVLLAVSVFRVRHILHRGIGEYVEKHREGE